MESADIPRAATPPSLELSIRQPIADPSVQQDNTQRLMPPPPPSDQPAPLPYHGRSADRQHRTFRPVAAKPYWHTSENDAQVANYMELKDQDGHMIQTSLTLGSSHSQQVAAAEFDRIRQAERYAIKRQKDLQALEEAAKRQKQLQLLEEASQQQGLMLAMEDSHMRDVINASFQLEYASKPAQITGAWVYKAAQAAAQRAAHELSRQSQPLRPSLHHQPQRPQQPQQPAHHNQNAFATPAPVSDLGSNWTNRALPVLNHGAASFGDKMSDGDTETAQMTIIYASMVNVCNDVPYELNYGQGPSEKSPLKKAMCSCPPANRMQPPNTPGHLFSELGPVVLPQPRPGPTFPHPPAPPSYGVNNMHAPRAYPSIQVMLPVESTTVVTTTTTSPPPPAMQLTSEAQASHSLRGLGMGFSSARQQTVPSTGLQLPQARKASLARFLSNRKLTQSREKLRALGGVRTEGEGHGSYSHERTEARPVELTNATVPSTVHSPTRGTLSPALLPQPAGGRGGSKPASPTRPPPTSPRQYFPQEKPPDSTSKRTLEHEGGEDNLSKPTQSGGALIRDEAPKPTDTVMDVVKEVLKEFPPSSSG